MSAADADLARDAAGGSHDAFRELVVRYQARVRSLIRRIVRNPSRADELAQDTFLKAYRQLHTFDSANRFSSWLLTIAHHVAIDELRHRHVPTEPFDEALPRHTDVIDRGAASPSAALERADVTRLIEAAMHQLRPEYAELLALRYEHDLDIAEIVAITNLPAGTVKSSLHRARQALAAALRANGWRTPS